MTFVKRFAVSAALAATMLGFSSGTAAANCYATINGRPLTPQECTALIQVYGRVIPGHYLMDGYGNWVNLHNPSHHGNIYQDARGGAARRTTNAGGTFGGGSLVSPHGVYDASGGCEGGSCVNIID